MYLFNHIKEHTTRLPYPVSILVLVDVPLQSGFWTSCLSEGWVSILVLVDVPLQWLVVTCKSNGTYVSILVLVDVPLQWKGSWFGAYCPWSFNPCFSGCTSSIFRGIFSMAGRSIVSILVLVDVPLQSSFHPSGEQYQWSFNPCFSGCTSSIILSLRLWCSRLCFNPCFSGCTSSIRTSGILAFHIHVSILVLVDVPLQSSPDQWSKKGHQGFNPCFSGCTSSIGGFSASGKTPLCFNPCFSGCTSSIGSI